MVLVHGGGRRITEWLDRLGVPSRFEGGLRVTDPAALEVAAAVLRGVVNSELVAGLRTLGVDAVGLSGVDGGLLIAERIPGARLVVLEGAAHLLSWSHPAQVNTLITQHLAAADRYGAGTRVRRSVLGDDHVDRAEARRTAFTDPFQDLITRYAWGEVWTRPGLDRRTRSCMVLTALVAQGHWGELAMHVRAALRNGLTPDEIGEVFLQSAVYCGVPAANKAFALAQEVLDEGGAG